MAKEKFDSQDQTLLEEIRGNFKSDRLAWKDIQDEGKKDIRYLSGDPFTDAEKRDREEKGRPLIAPDELNQYVNQLINNVRESKRGISVVPRGSGATDVLARVRQGIIREIEYKSKAQSAYLTCFEGCSQRGYGTMRIGARYISDSAFEQELKISRIPNPDSVLMDPECKEIDSSDASRCFVLTNTSKAKFQRDYKGAKFQSFSAADMRTAPEWIKDNEVVLAEYWKAIRQSRQLVLAKMSDGPRAFFIGGPKDGDTPVLPKDTKIDGKTLIIPGQGTVKLLNQRTVSTSSICQYITNGLEILDRVEWAGQWIPIIPMYGKEMYVDEGSGAKRVLMSLIRLARDPFKLYCYYRSLECEEATLSPKVPWMAAEGQLEGHETEWANAHKDPVGFLYYKLRVEGMPEGTILPPPSRLPFVPNLQQYEVACEGARRAIQAAIGSSPLPTSAQRLNDKSGVALKNIQQSYDHGSFHFIDSYDVGLETAGRQLNQALKFFYDTSREVGLRDSDDTHSTVYLNQTTQDPKTGEPYRHDMDKGEFEVTISTGPSQQSQRDAADAFADTLSGTPLFGQVADLVTRLKNLGPIGDQIAERLTPPQYAKDGAQKSQAMLAQAQQHLQAINSYSKQLEGKVQQLENEKNAKIVDNEYRMSIEKLKIEAQVTIAEIQTKAQKTLMRAELEADIYKQLHGDAHERGMQAAEQQHQKEQADAAQAAAAAQPQPPAGNQPAESPAQV